jgi:large subunit ribosomal protein L23
MSENVKKNDLSYRILIKPWITEASTILAEENKYVFVVAPKATKKQIAAGVESLYKVKVEAVNTIKIPRKFKNHGQTPGWKAGIKKAIITLKEGDKIDLFEEKK